MTTTTVPAPVPPTIASTPSFHPKDGVRCLYLRDRKARPVGLIMCVRDNGIVRFGWSVCDAQDTFRKTEARQIAHGRLTQLAVDSVTLPEGLSDTPMNRVLVHLSGNVEGVPQIVRHGARRAVKARLALARQDAPRTMVVSRTPTKPRLNVIERLMFKLKTFFWA
mgnify:FL=1